jgi:hypothetical protein
LVGFLIEKEEGSVRPFEEALGDGIKLNQQAKSY